ncbi:carcinoembryonic antigen-related cell adhesion molecule 5-like [Carcharodon carcharias]|uniref:carcinoembryonic antigen-related cell adhesion molecule 5-like n=1 Tax=Carcharodon carcharias TaxID=13397 RepID=UPI001B7EB1C3|nr:carcinoembryonic antigen-related cell adhesion molecule 5-like [Carcharodon carcharias]
MGQVNKECLPCLFFLIAPSLFPGSGAAPVTITVGSNPVRTGVGWDTTLSVANASALYSVEWEDPTRSNILRLLEGRLIVKPGTVYADRVKLQPNSSLTILSTLQADEGNYTVTMDPPAGEGLTANSVVLALEVYVPITNVSIAFSAPDVFEGDQEVRLTCAALTGSTVTFSWAKGSSILTNSSRVTVSGSELRIMAVIRDDAGSYTCTVQNPISQSSSSRALTVFYGPETAAIRRDFQSDCVVPDQVVGGSSGSLSCETTSVPIAVFTWLLNGQPLRSGSTIPFNSTGAGNTGNYTCIARNIKTANQISTSTQLNIVSYCLSVGAVVGIAIGVAAALLLLILLIIFLVRRRRAQKRQPTSKKPPKKAFSNSEEKVLPWISKYPKINHGISPTPIYSPDQVYSYSNYPPSNGSMVASTMDGGVSVYSLQTDRSGRLSTLV